MLLIEEYEHRTKSQKSMKKKYMKSAIANNSVNHTRE